MRAAIINSGVVVNVVELDNLTQMPDAVACPDGSPGDLFDGTKFSVTPKPLSEIKATKRSEIVNQRNAAITGGFTYLGKSIDSDRDSVMAITAAAIAAMAAKSLSLPFNDVWTCADDSTLQVDADQMIGMLIALAQHGSVQHAKARPLKDSIAKETDPDKIKKVKW